MKDYCGNESKAKASTQDFIPSNKTKKDKKKKQHKD